MHKTALQYLQELVSQNSSLCRLSISGFGKNTNKHSEARSFRNAAPTLWNRLSDKLHQARDRQHQLKSQLFSTLWSQHPLPSFPPPCLPFLKVIPLSPPPPPQPFPSSLSSPTSMGFSCMESDCTLQVDTDVDIDINVLDRATRNTCGQELQRKWHLKNGRVKDTKLEDYSTIKGWVRPAPSPPPPKPFSPFFFFFWGGERGGNHTSRLVEGLGCAPMWVGVLPLGLLWLPDWFSWRPENRIGDSAQHLLWIFAATYSEDLAIVKRFFWSFLLCCRFQVLNDKNSWVLQWCTFPSVPSPRPVKITKGQLFQPPSRLVQLKYSSGGLVSHCFFCAVDKNAFFSLLKSSLRSVQNTDLLTSASGPKRHLVLAEVGGHV